MEDLLPSSVFGLPLHPLVVHAVVILVPLTAVMVLLAAVVRPFRRWAGWLPLAAAAGCVVLTRVASDSGSTLQQLKAQHPDGLGPLVAPHQALGEQLIWWVLGVLVVALAAYVVARRERVHDRAGGRTDTTSAVPRWATVGVAVAGVLVATGAVVHTVRVGHSGAESVWSEYTPS